MSGPVDVLSVLSELAEGTTLMTRSQCARVSEARAAVADLIEVYEELLGELNEISFESGMERYNNLRANATLARVKGESQ